MKRGQLYVESIERKSIILQRLPDFADAICLVGVALLDCLQSLAVVLLHKNTFQLL